MIDDNEDIPDPVTVRVAIDARLRQQASELTARCVAAFKSMTRSSVVVSVPSDTPQEVVEHVAAKLRARGWVVRHWLGSQRDPSNELHITLPP